MTEADHNQSTSIHYFVDEAGDPTLFDAKGRVIVGNEGCSRYFILGKLDVADPPALGAAMETLRTNLLADPYFKRVPSMQPDQRKTALAFHAKDDPPEVRRDVFRLLAAHEARFYAVVRDKSELVAYVQQQNQIDAGYRYRPNDLYDLLVGELFQNLHRTADHVNICFAVRGQKDRTKSLSAALARGYAEFERSFGFPVRHTTKVTCGTPPLHPGLQAVDYFTWALQRFYERGEERWVELVWPQVGEIHDLDFMEKGKRGVYYRKDKPLTLAGREGKTQGEKE
jgi:hypothetical protein